LVSELVLKETKVNLNNPVLNQIYGNYLDRQISLNSIFYLQFKPKLTSVSCLVCWLLLLLCN